MIQKVKIVIRGVVQGVGFRPFIYRLAKELDVKGWIINSSQGVFIDAEADHVTLESFIRKIETDRPKNSYIQSFEHTWLDAEGFNTFEIRESKESGSKTALVLPDISTCNDCLDEIFDPGNRRYLYPFTNCTNCGPRYSIIADLPYDRCNTTMGEFEMCPECRAEYTDPLNRRFHAEPTACPKCGPKVTLKGTDGTVLYEKQDAIINAVEALKDGKIIALKGIGGYQLLCDASNKDAVITLRKRKRRSEKPFALMFPNAEMAMAECEVSEQELRLLCSVEAPIVLLKKKNNITSVVSNECAAGNPYLGIMLPYSPLHHILMKQFGSPIVATSGNISEEPICIDEAEAYEKLSDIADYFLVHNRKILRHVDDSIIRLAAGKEVMIRRARGYAPLPVMLNGIKKVTLAAGPHLKNTIALNKADNVFVSQHIGDLENIESINAFKRVINDIKSFYDLTPERVIYDLHPDYISTKYAESLDLPIYKVQHHYAHVLSCMAENELDGSDLLGVSWDGTGYGTDGTIWGGEFLVPQGVHFKRVGYFKPFRLPGGEQAIHDVWKIGLSLLYSVFGEEIFELNNVPFLKRNDVVLVKQLLDKNINSPLTTSAGRLFDGISAIIGIRNTASYEAQAAMELEFAADDFKTNEYFSFSIVELNGSFIFNWENMVKGLINDLGENFAKGRIAAKFHNTLAEAIVQITRRFKYSKVLLTGGCFLNRYLLEKSVNRLTEEGFEVYTQQRVPSGDGGISLGQMKFSTYIN